MATVTAPAPVARAAYREPAYLRYIAGQTVSIVGDQVWYVALSWAAVQLASPAAAGVVLAVSAIPRLALMLFGGVFVDRFGPRKLMIGSDAVRAAIVLCAAGVALWSPSIALLVVVSLVFGAADAIFMPAAGAMQPRLLSKEQYSSGAALRELTSRAALTLGAPLGGVLVAVGGLPLAALVDAVTFILSAVMLWTVRPRPAEGETAPAKKTTTALRDGLAYLRRNRLVGGLVLTSLLLNLGFVGPMNVGLALVSDERGWGSRGIGLLLAGFGIGAAASALVLLKVKPKGRLGYLLAAGAVIEGVCMAGLGFAGSLTLGVIATFTAGIVAGLLGVTTSSLVQTNTDDAYRGRVSSVSMFANLGVTPLAIAATGVAVDAFGLEATFTASALMSLAAAVLTLAMRQLRRASLD
ncbi:MFS transporter [Phytomonospora endophytica]|uniref:Putative MFS family arabinose efflux permease n=1 Tax=Phytomonospora endophytica TaxID=714109 RepID=A0A841FIS9_9ACTN|nr:MFS transporter [Phytomonospora endophytica]MBB6032549.1 putative MFS family arabinose efflux permease [Phytomonospora endophytica]GIG66301.1 MFS transporter [Phytomonospora endophytica]